MKTPETLTAVPSAPYKRNFTTNRTDQRGFCFADGLVNTLLMIAGALFGLMVGGAL